MCATVVRTIIFSNYVSYLCTGIIFNARTPGKSFDSFKKYHSITLIVLNVLQFILFVSVHKHTHIIIVNVLVSNVIIANLYS